MEHWRSLGSSGSTSTRTGPSLITCYRAEGLRVAPNHVITWEPYWKGGPGDVPQPAKELDAPPEGKGGPRVVVLDTGIQKGWDTDDWFALPAAATTTVEAGSRRNAAVTAGGGTSSAA